MDPYKGKLDKVWTKTNIFLHECIQWGQGNFSSHVLELELELSSVAEETENPQRRRENTRSGTCKVLTVAAQCYRSSAQVASDHVTQQTPSEPEGLECCGFDDEGQRFQHHSEDVTQSETNGEMRQIQILQLAS